MGPVIRAHNGFIDKYIGDAIMALFETADDALRAGLAMLDALDGFNKDRAAADLPAIGIGIGLNSGSLMLGTIGETRSHGRHRHLRCGQSCRAHRKPDQDLWREPADHAEHLQSALDTARLFRSGRSTSSSSRARPRLSPSTRSTIAIRRPNARPRNSPAISCNRVSRHWRRAILSRRASCSHEASRCCPEIPPPPIFSNVAVRRA